MTFRIILHEVWRNLLTSSSKSILSFMFLVAIITTIGLADALTVSSLVSSARNFKEVGAATTILDAPGSINGESCDLLSTLDGIEASGAVRKPGNAVVASVLPAAPLPIYESTSGFPKVLGISRGPQGAVFAPTDLQQAMNLSEGDQLAISTGLIPLSSFYAYPADGRLPGLGWALVDSTPVNAGKFDQCWVTAWPSSKSVRSLTLLALDVNSPPSSSHEVFQLNGRKGQTLDAADAYSSRITRYGPVLAFASAAAIGTVMYSLRRLHFAARRHDGASMFALVSQTILEVLCWSVPAVVVSALLPLIVAVEVSGTEGRVMAISVISLCFCAIAGAILSSVVVVMNTRERQLFRFFKDR